MCMYLFVMWFEACYPAYMFNVYSMIVPTIIIINYYVAAQGKILLYKFIFLIILLLVYAW